MCILKKFLLFGNNKEEACTSIVWASSIFFCLKNILVTFLILIGISNCSSFSQENKQLQQSLPFNVTDSLALVDFYYSVNGPACPTMYNWLVTPVRYWAGVTSDPPDSIRVVSIILHSRPELNGTLPLSIGDLSEIRLIDIAYTNISGAIPYTIGRLKKLKELSLYFNNFSGQITDSIGGCEKLEGLNIFNNNCSGYIPQSLTTLSYFTGLQIRNNQFDQLPDFSQLPNANNFIILVENNLLTFEDLEPNMNVNYLWFTYSPQEDSINLAIDTTVIFDTSVSFKTSIGGQHNIYQWYKDGALLPWATDSIITISNVAYADSGVYTCNVTNSVVTGIEFHRRPIKLRVKNGVGMNYLLLSKDISIFPNPNNGNFSISLFSNLQPSEYVEIDVRSMIGTLVKSCKLHLKNNKAILNMNLPDGMYIISMSDEEGNTYHPKKITVIN